MASETSLKEKRPASTSDRPQGKAPHVKVLFLIVTRNGGKRQEWRL